MTKQFKKPLTPGKVEHFLDARHFLVVSVSCHVVLQNCVYHSV